MGTGKKDREAAMQCVVAPGPSRQQSEAPSSKTSGTAGLLALSGRHGHGHGAIRCDAMRMRNEASKLLTCEECSMIRRQKSVFRA